MKDPVYVIHATWQLRQGSYQGYAKFNLESGEVSFESKQNQATLYKSKALASGYVAQAQVLFPQFKFEVIEVS